MFYPDFDDVKFIHDFIIKNSGGLEGIRDKGSVHAALERPRQSAFGKDAYKTTYDKAAALLDSLANNHAFLDGNKRTAMAITSYFLFGNDIDLSFTNQEYETFMLHVVNDKPKIAQISRWISEHSSPLESDSTKLFSI